MFAVEVVEVKERFCHRLTMHWAKNFDAENVEKLRAGVASGPGERIEYSQAKAVRGQLISVLLAQANFDLPESAVAHETKNVVYNIVQKTPSAAWVAN